MSHAPQELTNLRESVYRIVGERFNSLSHYNLVHNFMPLLRATTNPGCESPCGQRVEEARKIVSMADDQGEEQRGGRPQKERRSNHFATLMNICHLKNAELEPKF